MKNVIWLAALFLVLSSTQGLASEPTAEQKRVSSIKQVMQSTVKIAFQSDHNELHTTLTAAEGTGFYVGENAVLTAWHVVSGVGAKSIEITKYNDREWRGQTCEASLGYREEALDLVLLTVDCEGAPVALAKQITVGQDVFLGGNPASLDWIVTQGIASRIIEQGSYKQIVADIDADQGNSGGPLFDSDGNVVGVATAVNKKGPYLLFATHLEDIAAFIGRSGVKK